ncbi:MAG: hypothetical protein ACI4OW_04605 [Alphaproteobacteria bacterium]
MKLYSKEALLLGGIYGGIATPLAYTSNEILSMIADVLFWLFLLGNILLLVNKTPKFIIVIQNKFTETSYYLRKIGWIPYFIFLCIGFFIGSGFWIDYTTKELELATNVFKAGVPIMFIITLMYAFLKRKKI